MKTNIIDKVLKKRGRKKKIIQTNLPETLKLDITDDDEDYIKMNKLELNKLDSFEEHKNNNNLIKKNEMISERLKAVNIFLKMYPTLKKDKEIILNNILEKKQKKYEPYVIEKIDKLKFNAYIDRYNNIIDENINIIGLYIQSKNQYLFFDELEKMFHEIRCNYVKILKMNI